MERVDGRDRPVDGVALVLVSASDLDQRRRCLDALAQQSRRPDELFLLVPERVPADEASPPALPPAYFLSQRALGGVVGAKNVALAHAGSELIAFLDEQFVPQPTWLEELHRRLQDDSVAGAWSQIRCPAGPSEISGGALQGDIAELRTAGAMFRREALVRASGFDPTLPRMAAGGDLLRRLRQRGDDIVYEPRAVIVPQRNVLSQQLLACAGEALAPRAAVESPGRLLKDIWKALPSRHISPELGRRNSWFLYALAGPPGRSPVSLVVQLWRCVQWARRLSALTGPGKVGNDRLGLGARIVAQGAGRVLVTYAALWTAAVVDLYRRRRVVVQRPEPPMAAYHPPPPTVISRPVISACLITQNQEHLLPVALASVRDWVDEIVVVDGGSTDRSVEVCESFGARVVRHPWPGSYALQRNVYLREARGDWLVTIDSDECFADLAGEQIRRHISQSAASPLWVLRKWLVTQGEGLAMIVGDGIYPDMQTRVIRRDTARGYIGRIHEQLESSGTLLDRWAPDITLYHLDLVVHSREERERKVAMYARHSPGASFAWHYLWEDYKYATRPVPWEELPVGAARLLAPYTEQRQRSPEWHPPSAEAGEHRLPMSQLRKN